MKTNFILICVTLVVIALVLSGCGGEHRYPLGILNPMNWGSGPADDTPPKNHVQWWVGVTVCLSTIGIAISVMCMVGKNMTMGLTLLAGSAASLVTAIAVKALLEHLWLISLIVLALSILAFVLHVDSPGGLKWKKKFPFLEWEELSPSSST